MFTVEKNGNSGAVLFNGKWIGDYYITPLGNYTNIHDLEVDKAEEAIVFIKQCLKTHKDGSEEVLV